MKTDCEIVIVGAGPYGLSLAAHMRARGLDFRVFGTPLDSWRNHMPADMTLKSDGFASNLSAPAPDSTLKAYCAKNGLPYADQGLPVPLARFVDYAQDFRKRFVPELEETDVTRIERDGARFAITLASGERFTAARVVLAVGITWYKHVPAELSALSPEVLSHSFDHHDFSQFAGQSVAVIGAGASAVNSVYDLNCVGARPRIVTRRTEVGYNEVPDPAAEKLFNRIQRPASGIGRGWRSYFCSGAPLLFWRLPQHLKDRAIRSHMHPAGGWFMRDKVEGKVPLTLRRTIEGADMADGRAMLILGAPNGSRETMTFDRVIAATGFEPELKRLPFLAPDLAEAAASGGGAPDVSEYFETDVRGLYAVGLTAMRSFGPLMRFMYGADFAAPRLAGHFARLGRSAGRRAA